MFLQKKFVNKSSIVFWKVFMFKMLFLLKVANATGDQNSNINFLPMDSGQSSESHAGPEELKTDILNRFFDHKLHEITRGLNNNQQIEMKSIPSEGRNIRERHLKTLTSIEFLNCSNVASVHVFQTETKLLMVSNYDLFEIQIEVNESHNNHMKFIGNLDNIESYDDVLDVQACDWNEFIIVAVTLSKRYNIYITQPTNNEFPLTLIEKIGNPSIGNQPLATKFHKFIDSTALITVHRLTEDRDEVHVYRWRRNHFTHIQRRTIINSDNIYYHATNDNNKILMIVVNYRLGLAEIYAIDNGYGISKLTQFYRSSMQWLRTYMVDKHLFMTMCTASDHCEVYKFQRGQFVLHKRLISFDHTHYKLFVGDPGTQSMVAGLTKNELHLFTSEDLDKLTKTNCTRVVPTDIALYHGYIILIGHDPVEIKRSYINIVAVEFDETSTVDRNEDHNGKHEESDEAQVGGSIGQVIDCFNHLKHVLNERRQSVGNLKRDHFLMKNEHRSNVKLKSMGSILMTGGRFGHGNIKQSMDITPSRLMVDILGFNTRLNNILKHPHGRQRRDSPIIDKTTTIRTRSLRYTNGGVFQNLAQKSLVSEQKFTGQHLIVRGNLFVAKELTIGNQLLNGLDLNTEIARYSDSVITGTKFFKNLNVNDGIRTGLLNGMKFDELLKTQIEQNRVKSIVGEVVVDDVSATTVNGIAWRQFYDGLFRLGENTKIQGNLRFVKPLSVSKLQSQYLNKRPVNDLVTLSTDQEINSNIFIHKFYAKRLETVRLNEISFGKDIARSDEPVTIDGPTKIFHFKIANHLELSDDESPELARHIVGTQFDDLLQIYTKPVTIVGNLVLENVNIEKKSEKSPIGHCLVNERPFDISSVKQQYWMKSVDQKLETSVRVEKPIWTSQIIDNQMLNNHPIDKYLLNSQKQNSSSTVSLIFRRANIVGNVIVHSRTATRLFEINANAVRTTGRTHLSGKKFYENLVVSHLTNTTNLNNFHCERFFGRQHTRLPSLIVQRADVKSLVRLDTNCEFSVEFLDLHRNLREFFEKAVHTRYSDNTKTVILNNVEMVGDLKVKRLITNSLAELHAIREKFTHVDGKHREIIVEGDGHFEAGLDCFAIDGIDDWEDYKKMLVVGGTKNNRHEIGGRKVFGSTLRVNDMNVSRINNVVLREWKRNVLSRNNLQTVTGVWRFSRMTVSALDTHQLNGIITDTFTDRNHKHLVIYSDVKFNRISCLTGLVAYIDRLDLLQFVNELRTPRRVVWSTIRVTGSTKYTPLAVETPTLLHLLLYNTLLTFGDQEISGAIFFRNIATFNRLTFPGENFGHINLVEILKDSLRKSSSGQQTIQWNNINKKMLTAMILVDGNFISNYQLETIEINRVNVRALNESICLWMPITGATTFSNFLDIQNMFFDGGRINGVDPVNWVMADDRIVLQNPVRFDRIQITRDLNFNLLNGQDFNRFLSNRILLRSPIVQNINELQIFGRLTIETNPRIEVINNMPTNDLVYNNRNIPELVMGRKKFLQAVACTPEIQVTSIKGYPLREIYNTTLFLDRANTVREIFLPAIIVDQGLSVTRLLNRVDLNGLANTIRRKTATKDLVRMIGSCMKLSMIPRQKHLLYIDYAPYIHIILDKSASPAQLASTRSSMEVTSYRPGSECDLADNSCFCPVQLSLIIRHNEIIMRQRPFFERHIEIRRDGINLTISTEFLSHCRPKTVWKPNRIYIDHFDYSQVIPIEAGVRIADAKIFDGFIVISTTNGYIRVLRYDRARATLIAHQEFRFLQSVQFEIFETSRDGDNLMVICLGEGGVQIYRMEKQGDQKYHFLHTIPGSYNLIAGIYERFSHQLMIVLGRIGTQQLHVSRWNDYDGGQSLILYQIIELNAAVKTIAVIEVGDRCLLMAAMANGDFNVYAYREIEGWVLQHQGHFAYIEAIVPFELNGYSYILLSGKNQAAVLQIYLQG